MIGGFPRLGGRNPPRVCHRHSCPRTAAHRKPVVATPSSFILDSPVRDLTERMTVLMVLAAHLLAGNGNSWNKIRYSGGTVPAKVNPYDWNTTLTVTADSIILVFARRASLKLAPSQVTSLGYGEQSYRRVADMVTLSVVLVNPLVLFGILHQGKNHFVSIEFQGNDGKEGVVLLEADKNNYRAILEALKTVTGKPVKNAP
jgi:hypothetical protein